MLTLIEKAQQNLDQEKMAELENHLAQNRFTFDDFLEQLDQMKKMGDMKDMLAMVPGLGKQLKNVQVDDKQIVIVESMIQSMTKAERNNPAIINASRKRRIALGCGRQVQDINRLLKQYEQMVKLVKQMNAMQGGKGMKAKKGGLRLPF